MEHLISLACILAFIIHTCCAAVYLEPNCETSTKHGLYFVQKPSVNILTCENSQVDMYCCISEYTNLYWLKKSTYDGQWFDLSEYVGYGNKYYLEGNQTLWLQKVTSQYDETDYKCVASDDQGNVINATIKLDISECISYNEAPISITPVNNSLHYASLGENAKLTCEGFYGPEYDKKFTPMIGWYRPVNNTYIETWIPPIVANLSRFNVTLRKEQYNMILDLHIYNISKEDYGKYTCSLSMSGKNVINSVILTKSPVQGRVEVKNKLNAVLVGILASLSTFIVLTILLYYFKLDIMLYIKDRFNRTVNPNKIYDAFIVHNVDNEDDRRFIIKHMLPKLEVKFGYKLCLAERDFLVGDAEVNNYLNFMSTSQCLVFILSPAFLHNEWCEFIFQHAVAQEYRDMVFIVYKQIPDALWSSHNVEPLKKAISVAKHKIIWPNPENKRKSYLSMSFWSLSSREGNSSRNEDKKTKSGSQKTTSSENQTKEEFQMSPVPMDRSIHDKIESDVTEGIKARYINTFWKEVRFALQPRLRCGKKCVHESHSICQKPLLKSYSCDSSSISTEQVNDICVI